MKQIELLAPARDLECGIAAINCGADAVYIGASRFGARENAGNDLSDIAALIAHAHQYWAKVYATINTLLHDEEIPDALRLISQLYELGIDGLIIQDVGLLECDLPPIPLIASTQMHNDIPEKVAFLEQVGFQRVILARELDLDEIVEIRKQTSIELECFVHGALCVCYSGQCYLSYALGGRSGNRGQCAQPCRKPYSLVDGNGRTLVENKHLLSIKDLNLSEHLRELIDAGVSSFKIEGRLKDKAYVTNIVSYYRAKLDQVLGDTGPRRSSSGRSEIDFTPDPNKTFNRGYTTYFLHGRDRAQSGLPAQDQCRIPEWSEGTYPGANQPVGSNPHCSPASVPSLDTPILGYSGSTASGETITKGKGIGSIDTPKMVGETIGRVAAISRRSFAVETNIPLHNGDGICFFDRSGELRGTVINAVNGSTIVPDKMDRIDKGTLIYRNHDHEFLTRLEKSRKNRRMSVALTLREAPDGLTLIAVDEDGVTAEFSVSCEKALADRPDLALRNIKKQLGKMGDSDYSCSGVAIDLPHMYFIPISALNALRRGVLENLAAARLRNRPARSGQVAKNNIPYPAKELSYLANVLNKKAEAFYRRHGVTSIEPAAESGLDMRGRKLMTTRYCIKHELGICSPDSSSESLFLVDSEGRRLELRFDCDLILCASNTCDCLPLLSHLFVQHALQ